MGKPERPAVLSVEDNGSSSQTREPCCSKAAFRQIVTLVLSVQLLVFTLLMLRSHGKHGKSSSSGLLEVPIAASFRIRKSPSFIQSHLAQLERNISEEIGFPGKVAVVSIDNLPESHWTEVTIGLPLDGSENASVNLQMLKATFVKFFLRQRNISLSSNTFGTISDFQVEKFPGGITVVPEPSSLARRGVLFNFTIHNSLSHVSSQFPEFKMQLAEGLCLGPNENLITRLTNLNGSTSQPPVVVQISVFQAAGHHLPNQRLRQLAQHVTRHLSKNLGLNRTMFGHVHDIDLSPFLKHLLEPYHRGSPAPAPAPSPNHHSPHHPRHYHHHHKSYRGISGPDPAPHLPYLPPEGSPLSAASRLRAWSPLRKRESHWRQPALAPYPVHSPLYSVSPLPPKSDSSEGSVVPSPSAISLSVQAPLQDHASPVQPPKSSSCFGNSPIKHVRVSVEQVGGLQIGKEKP